jgi:hypothetical protein
LAPLSIKLETRSPEGTLQANVVPLACFGRDRLKEAEIDERHELGPDSIVGNPKLPLEVRCVDYAIRAGGDGGRDLETVEIAK